MADEKVEALRDRHLDCMLELVLSMQNAERESKADAPYEAEASLCDRTWEQYEEKRKLRNAQTKRRAWRRRLSRLVEGAACLVLAVAVATPFAYATNASFRSRVLTLLMETTPQYTALSLAEDADSSFAVPGEWQGEWYPSYVPEGYELSQVRNIVDYQADYINEAGDRLEFCEHTENTAVNIDTENADIRYVDVNGCDTMIITKGKDVNAVWNVADRYFLLFTEGTKDAMDMDTFIRVVADVRRIVR